MLQLVTVFVLHYFMLTPDGQLLSGKQEGFRNQEQCLMSEAAIGQAFGDLYGAKITSSDCRTEQREVISRKFGAGSYRDYDGEAPAKGW